MEDIPLLKQGPLFRPSASSVSKREDPISYVPALVVRRLGDRIEPLTSARAEVLTGAVLFADISGFTRLTESLARRGPRGAEELTQCLNAYFGQLIDLIGGHGGDVLKFAGDALIAFWAEGDDDLAAATLRAAACAQLVQDRLHDFSAGADVRLSLCIGIGAGPVSLFHVGGVNGRWEIVVSGPALKQMGTAKDQAKPGEVTLSREAWTLVAADADVVLREGGAVRLDRLRRQPRPLSIVPLPEVDPQAFLAYVPMAVVHHLQSRQVGWLSELRPVTVIFVNFPGLTPVTPIERAEGIMRDMQNTLFRFEAQINKLSVDDKGASLLAALGLPPLAHEDDAARALHAAMEMHERLRGLDVHHAIGLASGLAFCGAIGNDTRREYTMIGDVVNLAARLMQAAQDDVLCDQPTYDAGRSRVAFDTLPPIHVKGKAAELPVYRPVGAVRSAGPQHESTALLGRAAECAALRQVLDRAAAGTGSVAVFYGEAGVGKTRLLTYGLERARGAGMRCVCGRGDAIDKATPFHAWRPIFDDLLEIEADWITGRRRERAEAVLGPCEARWAPLFPLLNAVLRTDFPETPATELLRDRARAEATHELLVDLLNRVPTAGTVLMTIDDAQWMDSASWQLAAALARRGTPHVVLLAVRRSSDPPPDELGVVATAAVGQRIPVGRMSDDEAMAVARQALDADDLPAEVERIIRQKAEGNPLFVEELVRALKDGGLVEVEGRRCRLSSKVPDLRSVELPDTVYGAVMTRLDRLAASQKTVLKIAAVVGRVFDSEMVERLHPTGAGAESIAADLDVLCAQQITREERSESGKATYAFTQIVFQDVSYNLMLFSQRRQLHLAMAEWLECEGLRAGTPSYGALATHWRQAVAGGDADPEHVSRAITWLQKAGEQAVAQSANREAVALFADALHLLREQPDTPARAERELQLCCALGAPLTTLRGCASDEVEQTYARAWTLCQAVDHSPLRFEAILGLWIFHLVRAELHRARELAAELLQTADAMGIPDLQLQAHRVMGDTTWWMGDLTASVEHQDKAIAIYQPERHHAAAIRQNSQDPGVLCRAMSALAVWLLGDSTAAMARAEAAIQLAAELSHAHSYAIALHNAVWLHQFSGSAAATREAAERLIALARAEGFAMWLASGTVLSGWAVAELGDPARGCAEMERGMADWAATGAQLGSCFHRSLLASGYARTGRLDQAVEQIESALTATDAAGEGWWRPELLRLQAELGLAAGRHDRSTAERLLEEALALARTQSSGWLARRAEAMLARVRPANDCALSDNPS